MAQTGYQAHEPEKVPEWVDLCKQLAEIEEESLKVAHMLQALKLQVIRSATNEGV